MRLPAYQRLFSIKPLAMVSADPVLPAACLTVPTASEIPALKPYRVNPLYGIFGEVMETSATFEARSAPWPYPTRLMEGFKCRCREHPPLESVAPVGGVSSAALGHSQGHTNSGGCGLDFK